MISRHLFLRSRFHVSSKLLLETYSQATIGVVRQFSPPLRIPIRQISTVLKSHIDQGALREDAAQAKAARWLSRLQDAMVGYTNEPMIKWRDLMEKYEQEKKAIAEGGDESGNKVTTASKEADQKNATEIKPPEPPSIRIPRGLFLHGHVGTGKSMLMDLFFANAQVEKKRRAHFHSFLQDIHARIHVLKQKDLATHGRDFHVDTSQSRNPIVRVAKELASEVSLLCFDEFQVTDVADALIMKQLFEVLFENGTVVVATSNRPPGDLYEGGLNRSYFLPFIDLLNKHCVVHEIGSNTDYRRLMSQDMHDYFLVDSEDFSTAEDAIDVIFDRLLDCTAPVSMDLATGFGRSLRVSQAHPNTTLVGRFQFDELCNRELGSSDYRAIAEQFSIVVVERIPFLTLKEHDQARRFITLVDELYEARCALLCSAVADPEHLFIDGEIKRKADATEDGMETKVGEMFGIDVAQSSGRTVGELASVRELSFAFKRASSRLTEMCSRSWWEKATHSDES